MERSLISGECEFSRTHKLQFAAIDEKRCVRISDNGNLKRSAAVLYQVRVRLA